MTSLHLYITPESFTGFDTLTQKEIVDKLRTFAKDLNRIVSANYNTRVTSNILHVCWGIYETEVQKGLKFLDLISNLKDGDAQLAIWEALQRGIPESTPIQTKDIQEMNDISDGEYWYALIRFSEQKDGQGGQVDWKETDSIVYNSRTWLSLRRSLLGKFAKSTEEFMLHASDLFPALHFHPNCRYTFKAIFSDFKQKVTYHLGQLNDHYPSCIGKENDMTRDLQRFSAIAKLDETASLEGHNKNRLKFTFTTDSGQAKELICEPHMKLCTDDIESNTYYSHRIYFHNPYYDIDYPKILVAHIGIHL